MFAELRCSITVDNAVDTPVDVVVMWQRNGQELNSTLRVQDLPPRSLEDSQYEALLQFSTLSTSDAGSYMCVSTVSSSDADGYILNTTQTTSYSLTVAGKQTITYCC